MINSTPQEKKEQMRTRKLMLLIDRLDFTIKKSKISIQEAEEALAENAHVLKAVELHLAAIRAAN